MDLLSRKGGGNHGTPKQKGNGESKTLAALETEEFKRAMAFDGVVTSGSSPLAGVSKNANARKTAAQRRRSAVKDGCVEESHETKGKSLSEILHHSLHPDKLTAHKPDDERYLRGHINATLTSLIAAAAKKPGMLLDVFPVVHPKFRNMQWAWWDSGDGHQGGYKVRVQVREEDLRCMQEFELFPNHGRLLIIHGEDEMCEMPYVACAPPPHANRNAQRRAPSGRGGHALTRQRPGAAALTRSGRRYSRVSADNKGPPGYVFCAHGNGQRFPRDARVVMPAVKRLLFREHAEADRAANDAESARLRKVGSCARCA